MNKNLKEKNRNQKMKNKKVKSNGRFTSLSLHRCKSN